MITFAFEQLNLLTMLFFPNAKINIGLNITSKRPDNFHNLESIFYPIGWQDILEIIPSDKMNFQTSGLNIPGKTNLCLKAYEIINKKYSIPPVFIHLHKNIPIGAGLGGGSSNAAFTLLALNKIFDLGIDKCELKKLAIQLGADCPFFIDNIPSYVLGTGDILEPVNIDLSNYYLLVVKPNIFISTEKAFANVTAKKSNTSLLKETTKPVENWNIKNDFENYIFTQYPELLEIKRSLINAGAKYTSMSGSGSSIYGIFSVKPDLFFKNCHIYQQTL